MRIFENLSVDFLSKRKIAYAISGTLIVLSIISLFVRGLDYGIDFKGGTEIALEFEKGVTINEIRDDLSNNNLGNIVVKTFGDETGVLITTELQRIPDVVYPKLLEAIDGNIKKAMPGVNYTIADSNYSSVTLKFATNEIANAMVEKLFAAGWQTTAASQEVDNTSVMVRISIADWIEEVLREKHVDNPFIVAKSDNVGPKIGEELKESSVIAIFFSLVIILVYIWMRFKLGFALGAVIALFHDVIITLGLFSMFYNVFPMLNLEISTNVVSAFLVLVGYSINDTVVVFDRVRENMKLHKTAELKDNINQGISSTLPRTIITSLTTFIVVLIVFLFGGDTLRGMMFALLMGIIVGTYSSIFVANSFVFEYSGQGKKKISF